MLEDNNRHFSEEELLSILEDVLGDRKKHSERHKQISYDCPICSSLKGVEYDGKGNLEVNYGKGFYKCWSCGTSHNTKGTISKLIRKFGTYTQYRSFRNLKIEFNYEFKKKDDDDDDVQIVVDLPRESIPIWLTPDDPQVKPGLDYLLGRGLDLEIIEKHSIYFIPTGPYKDRVLIPSYNGDDELDYYITRSIDPKVRQKYKNPEADKQALIFNELLINWSKPITIVEGVFDHVVIDNSIPLNGKTMYSLLHKKLYMNATNKIFIALDGDAYDDAEEMYRKLDTGKLKGRIFIVLVPDDTDISELYQYHGYDGLRPIFKHAIKLLD